MWLDLITGLIIIGLFCIIMLHFGSKIQMRAWLQELEIFLKDQYIITKKEEKDEQTK